MEWIGRAAEQEGRQDELEVGYSALARMEVFAWRETWMCSRSDARFA
jgi:hypothetical protein